MKKWILGLSVVLVLSGCSILQAVALKDCTYDYKRISDVKFLNMTQKELVSISGIAKATAALLGKSSEVPLGFTVHMDVTNPNKKIASVERIYYVVELDTIQVASGCTTDPLVVPGETTVDLPLRFVFDLKSLLNGGAYPTLGNLVKNFIGLGDTPTNVTVHLKPVIRVGTVAMGIPKPIALHFTYGGKKEKE